MTDHPVSAPARDWTDEEYAAHVAYCHELNARIREGIRATKGSLWDTAAALAEFDEASGWKALGYENVSEYLADPDIGLTTGTFYRYVNAYQDMKVQQIPVSRMADIDISKVAIIMPAVRAGKVTIEQALDDAEALGRRDLRQTYLPPPQPRAQTPVSTGGDLEDAPPVSDGDDGGIDYDHDGIEPEDDDENEAVSGAGPPDMVEALDDLIGAAQTALALPQRIGEHRRLNMEAVKAVREALEALLHVL